MNIIEKFVDRYKDRSKNTVRAYRDILNKYFEIINKQPNKEYLKQTETEFRQDIEKYFETIKKVAPKTRNQRVFCIKSFFMRNGIELKTMFYRDLLDSVKEKGAITIDNVLTTEDIKKILAHGNEKDRAMIFVLATSGMRIGELLKLEEDNLKLDHDPPYIDLPGNITKNGYPRFTFITNEAKESVKEWLRIKKDYIRRTHKKNNLPDVINREKNENDPRLFPFTYTPIAKRWERLVTTIATKEHNTAERDKRTRRLKIHIHSLRSWANTRMLFTMPEAKVNFLVGHTTYLSKEYNKFKEADISEDYKKAIVNLAILETPTDLSGINESLKQKDTKIKNLEDELEGLKFRVAMMEKIEKMNEKINKIKSPS